MTDTRNRKRDNCRQLQSGLIANPGQGKCTLLYLISIIEQLERRTDLDVAAAEVRPVVGAVQGHACDQAVAVKAVHFRAPKIHYSRPVSIEGALHTKQCTPSEMSTTTGKKRGRWFCTA